MVNEAVPGVPLSVTELGETASVPGDGGGDCDGLGDGVVRPGVGDDDCGDGAEGLREHGRSLAEPARFGPGPASGIISGELRTKRGSGASEAL